MATLTSRDANGNPLIVGKKYRTDMGGVITVVSEKMKPDGMVNIFFIVTCTGDDGKKYYIETTTYRDHKTGLTPV